MERLPVGAGAPYDPIEASIHVGRYALALPFASGRRVLDIACGEGYGSWLLAKAGAAEVVGVDVSAEAVDKAKANFGHDRIRFITGAAESLEDLLPADHFDLIVSIETIEHVNDAERYLYQLKKLARRDATIIITCPNDDWYYGDGPGNPFHIRRFTFSDFQRFTASVLGENVQWFIGGASLGFTAIPVEAAGASCRAPVELVDVRSQDIELRVSPGEKGPGPETCSYFVGVWNAPRVLCGAGAHHALSMDEYSRMMWTANAPAKVVALQNELDALRAEYREPTANLAEVRSDLQAARREIEVVGIQAAALRQENEILSASLKSVEQREAALRLRVADLDASLRWHIERIHSLENEPRRRLLKRLIVRTIQASPQLERVVRAIFRRGGG